MSFSFGGNAGGNSGDKKPAFSFGAASTPTPNPPKNIFAAQNTTTPAGPPPATASFQFGQAASKPASNTFGTFGKGHCS